MKNINGKLEFTANVLIVVVAVLLIGVFAQRYLFYSAPVKPERVQPTIGKKLNLADTNFSEKPKTVVLALQSTCRFCNDSAPFYKKMLEATKGKNIQFVAVFPTEVEESRKHLENLGINGFEVKQASFSVFDVSSTPTLILTNSKGEVEKFWVGQLTAEKETEVINQLNS